MNGDQWLLCLEVRLGASGEHRPQRRAGAREALIGLPVLSRILDVIREEAAILNGAGTGRSSEGDAFTVTAVRDVET